MSKPTRVEMAALVDLAKRLRELPIPDCVRAADALEALMQERAKPVAYRMRKWLEDEQQWSDWLLIREKSPNDNPLFQVDPLYAAPPAKPAVTPENEIGTAAWQSAQHKRAGEPLPTYDEPQFLGDPKFADDPYYIDPAHERAIEEERAKPAGELPPQIEQALEESMRWHNGHQYRFSNNEEARKVWADHHESLTDALRAIRERE